jgi:hypothetical protein
MEQAMNVPMCHIWNSGRGWFRACPHVTGGILEEAEFLDKVMNLLMNHRDVILDQALNVHTSQMELWDRL